MKITKEQISDRPSRPASVCSFSTLRLNLVLTHEIPPAFHNSVLFYTVNRHRVSPEFGRLLKCVPTAFTAESPPAQLNVVRVTVAAFTGIAMDSVYYWVCIE